jgi:hypothetical protein
VNFLCLALSELVNTRRRCYIAIDSPYEAFHLSFRLSPGRVDARVSPDSDGVEASFRPPVEVSALALRFTRSRVKSHHPEEA